MDVELEEMEEGIVNHGDCAVDFAFFSVVEFEGTTGFVACWKGFPFDFVFFVFDMFASFSATTLTPDLVTSALGIHTNYDSYTQRVWERRSDTTEAHLLLMVSRRLMRRGRGGSM